MKKSIFVSLVFASLLVLAIRFGSKPLSELLGAPVKAGLKITSTPEASVSINGEEVGKTTYQDENLKEGEYEVKLVEGQAVWLSRIRLTGGTLAVVNRELSANIASSSGEILTLDPGGGVIIVSTPSQADVEIDGKVYGQTPLSVSELLPGDHTFIVSRKNYLKRSIRALLPPKMKLNIAVDLAVSEADLDSTAASPVVATKLIIKQTPTGFLRVRSAPSLNSAEVGRLSTGETVTQLEELSGWVKIRLNNGTEGYISSQYAQKQP